MPVGRLGPSEISRVLKGLGQVHMGSRVRGLELDGAAERGECARMIAALIERAAEIDVRSGVIGRERDGPAEVIDRLVVSVQPLEDRAQIQLCPGLHRIETDRRKVGFDRRLGLAVCGQRAAEIVVTLCEFRPYTDGAAVSAGRLVHPTGGEVELPEMIQRTRMVGREARGARDMLDRFCEAPRAGAEHAQ